VISVDTNILLYSVNTGCPEFEAARSFMNDLVERSDVVICELVLVELYILLRNPVVLGRPLPAARAVDLCTTFRTNPRWRLVEHAPVMDEVWRHASSSSFARRRIIDARLALTLRHHGVTRFATRNTRDFADFEFEEVWDPIDG
jgi:toxin-antitoxin system PIN domain toxin